MSCPGFHIRSKSRGSWGWSSGLRGVTARLSLPPPGTQRAEAQEPDPPEERQPPGAARAMAGGQPGEAPWLPPPGLPVPEHPQVSMRALPTRPPTQQTPHLHHSSDSDTLGPQAPFRGAWTGSPCSRPEKLKPGRLCAWQEDLARRLQGVKGRGVSLCHTAAPRGLPSSALRPWPLCPLLCPSSLWTLSGGVSLPPHPRCTHTCPVTPTAHTRSLPCFRRRGDARPVPSAPAGARRSGSGSAGTGN